MNDDRQKDQAFLDGQSNQNLSNLPTRQPKYPTVLSKENIDKAYKKVRDTGQISPCNEIFNTSSSTILKWRKKFPEFGQRISEALRDHDTLMNTSHSEFFIQAMAGMKKLLEERVVETTNTTIDKIYDPKTNEVIAVKERKAVKQHFREPCWSAIEKVLGKTGLKEVIRKSISDSSYDQKTDMIEKLFGEWVNQDDLGSNWDGNLNSDYIDLGLVRVLQAKTTEAFKNGEIDIDKYNNLALKQSKLMSQLLSLREKRAEKILIGLTKAEFLDHFEHYTQDVIDIIADVCYNTDLKKEEVPMEIWSRMSTIDNFRRYASWAREESE
ncbi:hypothetical protein ACFL0J_08195 [Candidatus Neomarinimicrobiota bacterium]